jgi:hypothetical protein
MSRRAGTDLGQDDPRQGLVPRIGLLWPEGSVLDKTGSSTTELYNDGTGGRALQ